MDAEKIFNFIMSPEGWIIAMWLILVIMIVMLEETYFRWYSRDDTRMAGKTAFVMLIYLAMGITDCLTDYSGQAVVLLNWNLPVTAGIMSLWFFVLKKVTYRKPERTFFCFISYILPVGYLIARLWLFF